MARWWQAILLGVNIPLFAVFGVRSLLLWKRERSPRLRSLLLAASFLAVVGITGALFHLGVLAADANVIADDTDNIAFALVQMAAAAFAIATGVSAWRAYRRAKASLGRAERVLIANSVTPLNVAVDELGLTAREFEVLEAVLGGSISDGEIAEQLYVSTATAASHVRNIMAKAGANTRRDLLTLLLDRDAP